ncbi:MAG: helix-hairpin-helix domain-containing protein, partial [Ignavibacteriaceae bacterium]
RKSVEIPAEKSINLNTANMKSLMRLPGIGPKTAEKIINYRKLKGKFTSLDELLKVKGIGKVKFSKIKKYLYIE